MRTCCICGSGDNIKKNAKYCNREECRNIINKINRREMQKRNHKNYTGVFGKKKSFNNSCLKCGRVFEANSKFNRICVSCKAINDGIFDYGSFYGVV